MPTEKNNPGGAPISACDLDHGCAVVACVACLTEIPSDVALSFEGPDYVHHFCGLDCLEVWKRKSPEHKL
jgi:hypothetical protein